MMLDSTVFELGDRFWDKVNIGNDDECWPWMAAHQSDGYGRFKIAGRLHAAHRLSLEIKVGRRLLAAELACHHCDNPPCVNPTHLFVGSHRDNTMDSLIKGRTMPPPPRSGEEATRVRLTIEQVERARQAHRQGEPAGRIAREFGVGRRTIRDLVAGITWRPAV